MRDMLVLALLASSISTMASATTYVQYEIQTQSAHYTRSQYGYYTPSSYFYQYYELNFIVADGVYSAEAYGVSSSYPTQYLTSYLSYDITTGTTTVQVNSSAITGYSQRFSLVSGTNSPAFNFKGAGTSSVSSDISMVHNSYSGYDVLYGAYLLQVNYSQTPFAFSSAQASNTPYVLLPDSSTWMTMVAGFGLLGGALRRRRRVRLALN